jgi:hypothetical protein
VWFDNVRSAGTVRGTCTPAPLQSVLSSEVRPHQQHILVDHHHSSDPTHTPSTHPNPTAHSQASSVPNTPRSSDSGDCWQQWRR